MNPISANDRRQTISPIAILQVLTLAVADR